MARITSETTRAQVVALWESGADIYDDNNNDVTVLVCHYCDAWVGDLSNPLIAHVSIEHGPEYCVECSPNGELEDEFEERQMAAMDGELF